MSSAKLQKIHDQQRRESEHPNRATLPWKGQQYRNERFFHTQLSRAAIHGQSDRPNEPAPSRPLSLHERIYWRGLCPQAYAANTPHGRRY